MYHILQFRERWTLVAVGASLAALALAGCGGGGGNDNSTPTITNSPFAGNYIGTFSTSNSQSGTLNVTAGADGTLTGSGYNNTTAQDETLTGSVTNAGGANVTFKYPAFTASATGTIAFASSGHLDGTLTQSSGGSVTINLVKQ